MEYKSNQHRQMAKVKNILSQIFFPKRLESYSHESYSGSCGAHAQWSLNPENGELRITGTGPLYDFFGEKEVPWESHLNHIRKVVVAHGINLHRLPDLQLLQVAVERPTSGHTDRHRTARLCLL